ncbi:hypothetical protein FOZ61_003187 [Perkinsus olseni]|uniref:Peptidase A1 domain-containing protein n=1 Tax=Perkinsus olseni TaxID=32597 RepID=A0A7J6M575_PEROL|nr:hypothetical protein FOZ61_003187 [Perkinsus olseni]KAF4666667.1 hypothetical protein FOL46_002889 [Perkinsus olseni]
MRTPTLSTSIGVLFSSVKAEPVSLPITEVYVPLMLDGQTLNFYADSGSARTFAIYGPMYEERHGKGSCDEIPSKCYFCPTNVSCDDIFKRKRWEVSFADGEEVEYVQHNVTLSIGGKVLPEFELGLIAAFDNTDGIEMTPDGLLGLSGGRSSIPETFLEQLKRRRVISDLVYSIHAEEQGPSITGNLILDDSSTTGDLAIPFSYHPTRSRSKIVVPLWSLRVFDSERNLLTRISWEVSQRTEHGPSPGYVDTGASSLLISKNDFGTIVNATRAAMQRYNKDTYQLVWQDPETRFNMIRREAIPYLPTLGYVIGEPPHDMDIRIEPKHYIHPCEGSTCFLAITPDISEDLTLGQPLFRAYDVTINLPSRQVHFSPHRRDYKTVAKARLSHRLRSLVRRLLKKRGRRLL